MLHISISNSFEERLERIELKLDQAIERNVKMGKEMDDLTAEVRRNTDVQKSALALIQGMSAKLTAAGTDPAKLEALRNELAANDDALAAAVAANTVAQPPAAQAIPANIAPTA